MYVDSAYVAKHYLNEPDSARVRAAFAGADRLVSSMWALAEVSCALQRNFRQGSISSQQYDHLKRLFLDHVDAGVWTFAPVTERLLRKMSLLLGALPQETYIRSGDALHLTTALDLGEPEIWSSDRHLLAAAPHFGITGRTV